MVNQIKYITRVEISGLWGRYDIAWDLNVDVNVLAGINGSGKTTILDLIYSLFSNIKTLEKPSVKIFFNDDMAIESLNQNGINDFIQSNNEIDCVVIPAHSKESSEFLVTQLLNGLRGFILAKAYVHIIKTFDTRLKPLEAIEKLSDERIKTELDWELHQLQIQYMDYQLNLGRKKDVLFKDNQGNLFIDNIVLEFKKLSYPQERLLDIIDELFSETHKKVNRDKNQLEFLLSDSKEINAYQLSSGEKQLLIILLTVLIQDNKPSILLMDEPEVSLHIDWQRKLIKYIRELNPYVQVILATHSPDIIMDGWLDKVFNVSDIIVKDYTSL